MDMKVLPADNYLVINKSVITDKDLKILNMLYLPITGALPIMLYNMLLDDLDKQEIISEGLEHNHIFTNLHIVASEFTRARNILEGIGLVKTYYKKDMVGKYIYELYSPVSAHEFFNHPIFNIVLYNNVGKKEYERLFNYFKIPKINKDSYEEITHSFNQVFESVPASMLDMNRDNIRKYNKLKLNINTDFDMDMLIETMPKNIDKKIFTKDIQELIISLSYLYGIDVHKMQELILSCINERGSINREELRKVCRNYYQVDNSGMLPTMVELTQPAYLRKPIGDNSPIAKMIYTFETVSPIDFLKSKQNGAEVPKHDVKILEELLVEYKLKPGVVNVLIDYVLKTNDKKLTRNLIDTIAGQWSRKKIETVEEAMEIAKATYKKAYSGSSKSINRKNITEVKKPVWFDQNIEADIANSEEIAEMENFFKGV